MNAIKATCVACAGPLSITVETHRRRIVLRAVDGRHTPIGVAGTLPPDDARELAAQLIEAASTADAAHTPEATP